MEPFDQTASEMLARWLPEPLSERVRVLRDGVLVSPSDASEFVVYWMHHSARGHENPALDVARLVASKLGLPLIVYQGLGGRHPFNNDRQHTFILQGARDVAYELDAQSIRHVFWLPRDPGARSPLHELAARAALFVTEDFPAPPFPRWTSRLAESCGRPTICVDASCIVPMQLVPGVYDRAFRFRDKTKKLYRDRADRDYEPFGVELPDASAIDVGFEPLDFGSCDIPAVCADCKIDHSVGPIAHTRGGSRAGYRRWDAFKERGIKRYHKRRNAAEIDRDELAVSRMSPYLHHGHVSPFRLMREARELLKGPTREGAEKYIDELWVWRELAHHLAFTRTDDLHSTRVLPSWARQTISDHADDPRELLDIETLSRASTGDALWDAAQRSLLAHGELHNNIRMTWGKALLGWHAGAQPTLDTLIDLNHRFALDGNDPNSYGGLLWCLGVLDRPFDQDEPIYGTIRTRSTAVHGKRMDLARYQRQIARPSWGSELRVAVIGGGISGMASARTLADQNVHVTVFDKGRGPGGRASTRRVDEHTFDHGAQYFTARDPRFRRVVESWEQIGMVAEWRPRLAAIDTPGRPVAKESRDRRYVGVPGMSGLVRHLADTLGGVSDVRFGQQVTHLERQRDGWRVSWEQDNHEDFDALIVALPAPQAHELLRDATPLADECSRVTMEPCWAVMLGFDERIPVEVDGLFLNIEGAPLSWASRDSSKPGRPDGERWVLHATPSWTRDHLEMDREQVAAELVRAFEEAVGVRFPEASYVRSHRWRYALGALDDSPEMLFDGENDIVVVGDWCCGGRIEGAYLSGVAGAGRLIGHTVARASEDSAALRSGRQAELFR